MSVVIASDPSASMTTAAVPRQLGVAKADRRDPIGIDGERRTR